MDSIYISDLDGTLLKNSGALSEISRDELNRLIEDGMSFSVASARSVVAMQHILRGLRLKLPVIEFNGAFLSDLDTGQHEIVNAIPPEITGDLHDLLSRGGAKPLISTFSGTEDCLYYNEILNEGVQWYVNDRISNQDKRLRRTQGFQAALREQVVCFTCIGAGEMLSDLDLAIRAQCGSQVETHLFENLYSPGWHWLTIHDRKATKDQAVRTLMETRGLQGRELIVFGDQVNDLKLFQMANTSVAVANAVSSVLEKATHVIGANENDSVVKFIGTHWAGRLGER